MLTEACFVTEAEVMTDQGPVPIHYLQPHVHTLGGQRVLCVTQTNKILDSVLIEIFPHALAIDVPHHPLTLTGEQRLCLPGSDELVQAKTLLLTHGPPHVVSRPYRGETLYNVLLDIPYTMNLHGVEVETLHPHNHVAILSRSSLQEKNAASASAVTNEKGQRHHLLSILQDAYVQRVHQTAKQVRTQRLQKETTEHGQGT